MTETQFIPESVFAAGADVPTSGYYVARCQFAGVGHGAFAWKGVPASDMRCPICLGRLATTTRRLRQPFQVVSAVDANRAAIAGAQANLAAATQTLRDLDAQDATRDELVAAVETANANSREASQAYKLVADAAFDSAAGGSFHDRMAALRAVRETPEGRRLYDADNAAQTAAWNEQRALNAYDRARKAEKAAKRYAKRLASIA